jgi:hypothetical protein
MLEKDYTDRELRAILVKAQKKRRAVQRFSLLKDDLSGHDQSVGRNMDIKVHSDATVDGNEDYLTGN